MKAFGKNNGCELSEIEPLKETNKLFKLCLALT